MIKKYRVLLFIGCLIIGVLLIAVPISVSTNSGNKEDTVSKSSSDNDDDESSSSDSSVSNSYSSSSSSETSSETSVSSSTSSSELESSSSSSNADNSEKYLKKVESLSFGTASGAEYDKDTNTLTYIGFDAWSDYNHKDLQNMMDILETIANRQAVHYEMHNPAIDVKLPDGTLIAHSDGTDDIEFVN